jgi:hypothetical protein
MRFFKLLIFFIVVAKTFGQEKVYSTSNLLLDFPIDHIYTVVEDTEKYIWICTDNGVIKFNGSFKKPFNLSLGLPTNDIFDIFVDSQNRKWIIGYYSGMYYIENDKIYRLKKEKNIKRINKIIEIEGKICLFEDNKIHILYNNYKLLSYNSKTSFNPLNYYPKTINEIIRNDISTPIEKNNNFIQTSLYFNQQTLYSNNNKLFLIENNKYVELNKLLRINLPNNFQNISKRYANFNIIYTNKYYVIYNNKINTELTNKLNKLNLDKNAVNHIYIDTNNNFWIINNDASCQYVTNDFENITGFSTARFSKSSFSITGGISTSSCGYFMTPEKNYINLIIKHKKYIFYTNLIELILL